MSFPAHVVKVLIASPGDTSDERQAVEQALHDWNVDRAERESAILLPWLWERHAVPRLGDTAQGVINSQAVDNSDVVLALFDARLGEQTAEAVSGTAEEIQRADDAGKPVHVWFSKEPISRDRVDLPQLEALNQFKDRLSGLGLLGEYSSPGDLAYKVRAAIEHDLPLLGLGTAAPPSTRARGAVLRSHFEREKTQTGVDSKGKPKFSTRSALVLQNIGDAKAEGTEVVVEAPGGEASIHFGGPVQPFDLLPQAQREFLLMPLGADEVTVITRWTEDGHERSEKQTISV